MPRLTPEQKNQIKLDYGLADGERKIKLITDEQSFNLIKSGVERANTELNGRGIRTSRITDDRLIETIKNHDSPNSDTELEDYYYQKTIDRYQQGGLNVKRKSKKRKSKKRKQRRKSKTKRKRKQRIKSHNVSK